MRLRVRLSYSTGSGSWTTGNQDRLYTDGGDSFDFLDDDFNYDVASARIVGRDVGPLLTGENRELVERILSEETRCRCGRPGNGDGAKPFSVAPKRFTQN